MRQVNIGRQSPGPLHWSGIFKMSEPTKDLWLRLLLRLLAIGYFAAYIPWITLILLKVPILAPGGSLAPLLRFQPYNANYESMLVAIHLVWAVMLWRAASKPGENLLFIDFTIWASAAHGVVMLIATPMQKDLIMTFIEALPLFGMSVVFWYFRPVALLDELARTRPPGARLQP